MTRVRSLDGWRPDRLLTLSELLQLALELQQPLLFLLVLLLGLPLRLL